MTKYTDRGKVAPSIDMSSVAMFWERSHTVERYLTGNDVINDATFISSSRKDRVFIVTGAAMFEH